MLNTVQDQFFDYMMGEAIKQDVRVLIENKAKFLLVSSSCTSVAIELVFMSRFMHHLAIDMLLKASMFSCCRTC